MDPVLLNQLKRIVKRDMKDEIDKLRNSDEGCTEKCRLANQILDIDRNRSQALAENIIKFEWCQECCNTEQGAVT